MLRKRLGEQREQLIPQNLKAIVFDFDGVFTDNRVSIAQNGEESVNCNCADGLGSPGSDPWASSYLCFRRKQIQSLRLVARNSDWM